MVNLQFIPAVKILSQARFSGEGEKTASTPQSGIGKDEMLSDYVTLLSQGNPKARQILEGLMGMAAYSQDFKAKMNLLMVFDSLNIQGDRIVKLNESIGKWDPKRTIGVLRAHQLGIIDKQTLDHAIDNQGEGLDVTTTLQKLSVKILEMMGI